MIPALQNTPCRKALLWCGGVWSQAGALKAELGGMETRHLASPAAGFRRLQFLSQDWIMTAETQGKAEPGLSNQPKTLLEQSVCLSAGDLKLGPPADHVLCS